MYRFLWLNITVESIQGTGREAGHSRFPPSRRIDVRLGIGVGSCGGEEVDIAVKHRTSML